MKIGLEARRARVDAGSCEEGQGITGRPRGRLAELGGRMGNQAAPDLPSYRCELACPGNSLYAPVKEYRLFWGMGGRPPPERASALWRP